MKPRECAAWSPKVFMTCLDSHYYFYKKCARGFFRIKKRACAPERRHLAFCICVKGFFMVKPFEKKRLDRMRIAEISDISVKEVFLMKMCMCS
jgi:hypothetical protein